VGAHVIDVRVGYGTALRAAKETFSAALGGSSTTGATATPLLSGPSNRSCGNSRTTLSSCERPFASTENVFESIKAAALERIAEALP
jgi:hypothetical protein